MVRIFPWLLTIGLTLLLAACSSAPQKRAQTVSEHDLPTVSDARFEHDKTPSVAEQNDACLLLENYPHWKVAMKDAQQRWGIAPWMQLAFIYYESRFNRHAMSKSKAYGYAQVKADTWRWYQEGTGNFHAKRDRFDDAVDFMGFYVTKNNARTGVEINNVKNQYLAYHEGMGGFERGTYIGKPWLLSFADKIVERAKIYQGQLLDCPL